jgi:phage recombination protein Bet
MNDKALTTAIYGGMVPHTGYQVEQLATLKQQLAPKATPTQFSYFLEFCGAHGFNPFTKQAYLITRDVTNPADRNGPKVPSATIQIGIDGYRMMAEKSAQYEGQTEPQWCAADGIWRDIWPDEKLPPFAAKVGVYRAGWREPVYGVAKYSEFVQMQPKWVNNQRNGTEPNDMWQKMPSNQLAKCAEAAAMRKAFPQVLTQMQSSIQELGGGEFTVEVGSAPLVELAQDAQPPIEEPKRKSARPKATVVAEPSSPVAERTDVDHVTGEVLTASEAASEAPAPAQAATAANTDGTPMTPDDWNDFWTEIGPKGLRMTRGQVLAAAGVTDIGSWKQEQIAALVRILRGMQNGA